MSSSQDPRSIPELPDAEGGGESQAPAAAHIATSPPPQCEAFLQMALAERDALLAELTLRTCALDAAPSHFMIIDITCRPSQIRFVNQALASTHGYEPLELIGQSPGILIATDLCQKEFGALNEAMRRGESARAQLRSLRKDGSSFWAGISVSPVRDADGCATHYVSVGTDITRKLEDEHNRRELQERLYAEMQKRESMAAELRLAQKLEAVGQLAAGIAHEINTPVQYVGDSVLFLQSTMEDFETLLTTYREVLDSLPESEALSAARERVAAAETAIDLPFLFTEAPKAFERTLDGVGRVAHIVRAMKEFAHPGVQEQSAADINHALDTTLTVSRNEYKYSAVVETRFGTLPEVICNIGELNQVFLNLIVNAAHAIQASGQDASTGRIVVTTETNEPFVHVSIEDNGCGIPEQVRDRIFDPFFTTKEVGKGTGQGLAIARSIVVEKHAGRIDVRSEPGTGTTFTLVLPVAGRNSVAVPP